MSSDSKAREGASLRDYIAARLGEADRSEAGRREVLDALADAVATQLKASGAVDLMFICTHNSRRSQFGQVWAAIAAEHFGIHGVRTWSGGTEVTAFNARAVAALVRAGLHIEVASDVQNPVHRVRLGEDREPMRCWSKRFDDARNPRGGFLAVMTCSAADEGCPTVRGAVRRLAITYEDPGLQDGTSREAAAYDERCQQIAREMLYVFERVAANR